MSGNFLLIYICNFHVLSDLLLIYICKLHWNQVIRLHDPWTLLTYLAYWQTVSQEGGALIIDSLYNLLAPYILNPPSKSSAAVSTNVSIDQILSQIILLLRAITKKNCTVFITNVPKESCKQRRSISDAVPLDDEFRRALPSPM